MLRNIFLILIFGVAMLSTGCTKNLYFGTSTSVGLDVSGTSKIPNKVSFAFDREEVAIVPDDDAGNAHSVFAALDSEWTWFNGFIVKQTFATGEAADRVSDESKAAASYTPLRPRHPQNLSSLPPAQSSGLIFSSARLPKRLHPC